MKRLIWVTSVVLATLIGVLLAWQFREAVWLFLLSLAVAAAFRPLINNLIRRGVSLGLALIFVYGLGFGLLGVLFLSIASGLLADLQKVANDFALGYQYILVAWPQGTPFQQAIAARLPTISEFYGVLFGKRGTDMLQTIFGFTMGFFEVASYLGMILVLSIYWTADRVHFERLWLSLIPVEYRGQARGIWREIELNIGAYIRSEMIQSLLAGVLLGVGYWLIGLNYPILLALIGTLAWFIPVLGAFLALLPVIWVGLTTSFYIGIGATLYTLLIFLILEYLVEPHFFNQRQFSGLLQVLIMVAFVGGFGVFGLLLAPPVAIAVQILFGQLIQQQIPVTTGKTSPELDDLRHRVAKVRSLLAKGETQSSPQVTSMLKRLEDLLEEAGDTPIPQPSGPSSQEMAAVSTQIIRQPSR